jgi:pyruvate formate lyase activating enzyme
MYHRTRCVGCGRCLEVCPTGAIRADTTYGLLTDHEACTLCGRCVDACVYGARERIGERMSVGAVLQIVKRDRRHYDNSGGGVTLTGGEPLLQCEFARELLRACKAEGIHTAIETSGHTDWDCLESVLSALDLVFYDIKHIDDEAHRTLTGGSNESILSNLERLTSVFQKGEIIVRIPFVPGCNDADDIQDAIIDHVASLVPPPAIEIMPYHRLGSAKYEGLGRAYSLSGVKPVRKESLVDRVERWRSRGIDVRIDGS